MMMTISHRSLVLRTVCHLKIPLRSLFTHEKLSKLNKHLPRVPVTPPEWLEKTRMPKEELHLEADLVAHLERTALVDFGDLETVEVVREAIHFVQPLQEVDTSDVEPMFSVLEDESLRLREDVAQPTSLEQVLSNAKIVEEDFYVAPKGNVELEVDVNKYERKK